MARPTAHGATRRAAFVALSMILLAVTGPSFAAAGAGPTANVWSTERRVLNMAHGGGLDEAPQGTVFAYETAAARGANALEMDLHITRDGHVVALHDSTVDRTTDGTGCVVDYTLAELKELDAAHTFVPGRGPVTGLPDDAYPYRGIATGDVPPPAGHTADDFTVATLAEIFEAEPDALMVMELKPTEVYPPHDCPAVLDSIPIDERPDLAAEVARLIDVYDMTEKVMVASFIDDLLHRFQTFAPDVDTSFPVLESLDVYLAYVAGDPLPNPYGHEAFQVPLNYGGIEITEAIVQYAQAHGVAVHFWTINDPEVMHRLLDWGADGLITDVPQVLSDVLAERGEPQPVVRSSTVLAASPAGPTSHGTPLTFTAAVESAWPYPPTSGSVELRSDGEVLVISEVVDGTASFTLDALAVGEHELVATYLGSARIAPSMSEPIHVVVSAASTTTTTSTTAGSPSATLPEATTSTSAAPAVGVGPPDDPPLPATGRDLTTAWAGLLLTTLGGGLLLLLRRRSLRLHTSNSEVGPGR